MIAISSETRGVVLIAALSGRGLAQAARRAGYAPLVADFFADRDTAEAADATSRVRGRLSRGFRGRRLRTALEGLANGADDAPLGLVAGSGFEDRPRLLEKLARQWRLLGTAPEQVARVNDPLVFFACLARLGIPHPETRSLPPLTPEGWLAKRIGGAGGSHISPARRGHAAAGAHYFQRHVDGTPVSCLFAANGEQAAVIGFSEQWAAPAKSRAHRYGGAVQPADVSLALRAEAAGIVHRLTQEFALRGLCSLDMLIGGGATGGTLHVLEVNARPSATLDIFDTDAQPLFAVHMDAVDGRLPERVATGDGARAAAIVYAPRRIETAAGFQWPEWCADISGGAAVFPKGAPVCTVFAACDSKTDAKRLVTARVSDILAQIGPADDADHDTTRQETSEDT